VKDDSSSGDEDSDQEVAFVIRNIRKFMKNKGHQKKKRFCYGCGQTSHFIAECPNMKDKNKFNKNNDKKYKGKKKGEAHLGEEWVSNDSDSSDEEKKKKKKGAANIAIHKSSSSLMNLPNKASPPKLFPNLDSTPSLFANLIDDDYYTPTCLMAKGEKVTTSSETSSDEYDSCDENIEQLEASLIKKFGHKAFTKIKGLMKKLENKDRCLEMQGDIIVQEKEKNVTLEASIIEEKTKVEKLTVELSLANDSIGKLTKEHSSINDQVASLKNENSIAQESLTSFKEKYRILELNYNALWASTSTSPKVTKDPNVSTSNGCKRCYKIVVNAHATNHVELEKKDKEINRMKMEIKKGCKCQEQSK